MFLLLAGAAITFLFYRESGDQKLTHAREASKIGAYPQAIEHFQDFLNSSPSHPEHSLARVQLANGPHPPGDRGQRIRPGAHHR